MGEKNCLWTYVIILFFIILTIIFTFPLVFQITTTIYGYPKFTGDPFGTSWWIWWYQYAITNNYSPNFVHILNHPFGVDWRQHPTCPLLDYPLVGINLVINNEVLTYNLAILFGILLTALAMYLLVSRLVKNRICGVLSAVIFAFSPNQLMHSAQHLGFSINFWIPIYILVMLKMYNTKKSIWAFTAGLVLCILTLTNYYYGFFMVIFTIVFVIWALAFRVSHIKLVKNLLISAFWFSVFCLPWFYILLKRNIFSTSSVGYQPYEDLFKYAARWWDYFLPSEFHPLSGGLTKRLIGNAGRHYFERSLYLGYIPFVLAVIGVIKQRKFNPIVIFFSITAFLFFIFSLSPILQISCLKIPNLSFFTYKILPMFRVYARVGVFVILSIAVLAAYGLKYIMDIFKNKWGRYMFSTFFLGFVLLEYINFPPFHSVDISNVPDAYKWLAGQPEDIVVAEYPYAGSIEEIHSGYLFYQRYHKKKLINGGPPGSLGDAFRKECADLSKLHTAKLLAYLGAEYVLFHKEQYKRDDLAEIDNNPGLKMMKDFPTARIYMVKTTSDDLIYIFWKNFANWEKWPDGRYWRWLGNDAVLWIWSEKSRDADIVFKILSFAKPRELCVYMDDVIINRFNINAPTDPDSFDSVVLRNVSLKKGVNIIKFYTPQDETRISDILRNNDTRCVSFAIADFSVIQQ